MKDPMTESVLELMRRRPGPIGRYWPDATLGREWFHMVYVYPPIPGSVLPPPRVRVVGVKHVYGLGERDVEDEIGVIEGVLGGAEFSSKLAELVVPRFGSLEQFQASYPRIVFERA